MDSSGQIMDFYKFDTSSIKEEKMEISPNESELDIKMENVDEIKEESTDSSVKYSQEELQVKIKSEPMDVENIKDEFVPSMIKSEPIDVDCLENTKDDLIPGLSDFFLISQLNLVFQVNINGKKKKESKIKTKKVPKKKVSSKSQKLTNTSEDPSLKSNKREKSVKQKKPTDIKHNCMTCGKTFLKPKLLKNHQRTHDKKFECQFCNKKLSHNHELKMHIKNMHESPNSFECKTCGKKFNVKKTLVRHEKTHDSNQRKAHKCEQCYYSSDSAVYLKKHMNRMHKIKENN
ncbi:zinc finger protein 41-like [Chironomus tepperi]|uniref:zinc finger protein 41-like n=1 Tax=Chironomus tepperi TaxID=113505 RepID=UPI00391F263C